MNYLFFIANLAIVFFAIWKLNLIGWRHVSAPGFYFCLSVLPTISLVFLPDEFGARVGLGDYRAAILLHSLGIFIGLFFSYFLLCGGRTPNRQICNRTEFDFYGLNRQLLGFLFFLVAVSFVSQILILPKIPMLEVFSDGGVAELTNAREQSYKLQGSAFVYLWHFSRMVLVPAIVVCFFVRWMVFRGRINLWVFLFVLIFGVVNNAMSGAKAPVALVFVCIFLSYIYIARSVSLFFVFLLFFGLFVFPFLVEYAYSERDFFDSVGYFFEKVLYRFSYETFDRTLSYFDIFPYSSAYLGGRTNGLFQLFTGQEYFNVQNYVFLSRLDVVREHLLHGSANAHFIGYMNADFGLLGVFFSCVAVGLVLGGVDVFASRRVSDPLTLALYVSMAYVFWKLMGSQPTTVFFSHGALLCLMLIVANRWRFSISR